jgi:hypothetical protein
VVEAGKRVAAAGRDGSGCKRSIEVDRGVRAIAERLVARAHTAAELDVVGNVELVPVIVGEPVSQSTTYPPFSSLMILTSGTVVTSSGACRDTRTSLSQPS